MIILVLFFILILVWFILTISIKKSIPPKSESKKDRSVSEFGKNQYLFTGEIPIKSYPVSLYSKSNKIDYSKRSKTGRKGYTEDFFESYLRKYFSQSLEILVDVVLPIENNSYEPDFALRCILGTKVVLIDVEIDEPYEGVANIADRNPIHIMGTDDERNQRFLENGWNVIRFSKKQIVTCPKECCKFIALFITSISSGFAVPNELKNLNDLFVDHCWTNEEARLKSHKKYRESYLGIDTFGGRIEDIKDGYECIYVASSFGSNIFIRKIINIHKLTNLRVLTKAGNWLPLIGYNKGGVRLDKYEVTSLVSDNLDMVDRIYCKNGTNGDFFVLNLNWERVDEDLFD